MAILNFAFVFIMCSLECFSGTFSVEFIENGSCKY
jgi:hypothetical protein